MTPTDHIAAARTECKAIRTDADFDAWHDTFATGEAYLNLTNAQVAEIEALAQEGRERVMRYTFPILAG